MNYKKYFIIISVAFVIVLGGVIGYYSYTIKNLKRQNESKIKEVQISMQNKLDEEIQKNNEKNSLEEKDIETSNQEEKITPNTIFTIEKFYQDCGYTVVEETVVPYDLVNMTKEEIENKYVGWTIREFSSKEVIMYKVFEGRCEEHYVLKENEGYIDIYQEDESGNIQLLELTDISVEYLGQEDKDKLKEGIKVHGKIELEKLLEDYNS